MPCRVAIVASSTPPNVTGGIASAHWNLYLALKATGHTVKVFTFDDGSLRGQCDGDIVRHGSPAAWKSLISTASGIYRAVLRRIEGSTDHAYQLAYVLQSMIGARRISRSLAVFDPEILIIPDNGAPGYSVTPPAGCRTVFVSHHNFVRFVNYPLIGSFSAIDARLAMYFERRAVARADAVICPSAYMRDVFAATHEFPGIVDVIPNIVDQDFIAAIPAMDMHRLLGIAGDSPIFYIPAAGSRFKGARFVFEIIRRLSVSGRQVGFYLSGNINDDLQAELKYVPGNAVLHSPGSIDYAGNISMVKGCSACVSPTLIESFGMAALEANTCGLPVVTFDVGGNADIISDGINGYLAPFLDVERLICGATALLDPDLLGKMRESTLILADRRFATEKIVKQYVARIATLQLRVPAEAANRQG